MQAPALSMEMEYLRIGRTNRPGTRRTVRPFFPIMDRRQFVTTLGVSAAGLALTGCTELGSEGPPADDDDFDIADIEAGDVEEPEALTVTEHQLVITGDDTVGVLGKVKNTADERVEFAEVTATIYDKDENVIDQVFDNTEEEEQDGLAAGAVWDFEIWFDDAEAREIQRYTLSVESDIADQGLAENGQNTSPDNETQTNETDMNQTTA